MNFFDSLVIPQSEVHIELLHLMLILLLCLFIPFISLLFGGSILSLAFRIKGYKEDSLTYLKFSKDLIDISTISNKVGIILGIAPLITAVLIFIQLLHETNTNIVAYLIAAFFISTAGIILIYFYKHLSSYNVLFDSLKEFKAERDEITAELHKLRVRSIKLSNRVGGLGVILVLIGMWLFIAGFTFSAYPDSWAKDNFFNVIFSLSVISRYISFVLGSLAITGGALFFNFFWWEGGRKHLNDSYKNYVRNVGLKISFTAIVLLPIFLLIDIVILPEVAVSGALFSYSIGVILLIFLVLHLLYSMIKYSNTKYSGSIFFAILFILFFTVIKDELAMSNATHMQSVLLSSKFDAYMNQFKVETAVPVAVRTGEEIYQTVCSACHRFDQKVVGPAYDNVLPKYEGRKDALVAFIRNPVKVNPNFPPMPNPGLKLDEAKNIANYEIIHHMQDVFAQRRTEAGNDGQKIFNRICAACHAYDHEVVGPAFNDVLTKYVGKENDLISFVSNPQKINPNFPQMPNPGLSPQQLKAITTYVLTEYRTKK